MFDAIVGWEFDLRSALLAWVMMAGLMLLAAALDV